MVVINPCSQHDHYQVKYEGGPAATDASWDDRKCYGPPREGERCTVKNGVYSYRGTTRGRRRRKRVYIFEYAGPESSFSYYVYAKGGKFDGRRVEVIGLPERRADYLFKTSYVVNGQTRTLMANYKDSGRQNSAGDYIYVPDPRWEPLGAAAKPAQPPAPPAASAQRASQPAQASQETPFAIYLTMNKYIQHPETAAESQAACAWLAANDPEAAQYEANSLEEQRVTWLCDLEHLHDGIITYDDILRVTVVQGWLADLGFTHNQAEPVRCPCGRRQAL